MIKSKKYYYASKNSAGYYNKKYNLQGDRAIPNSMINGLEFKPNSGFAQRISSDKDVQSQIMKSWNPNSGKFNADKIPLEPSSSKNLKLSIGHATILNPHVTSDGYFEGTLYDKYDFTYLKQKPQMKPLDKATIEANNHAVDLHEQGKLEYYYYFVPVKFKIPVDSTNPKK